MNIRSVANAATIRREQRNGRDLIIVPSATLPDDVVMNGILYPADEIAKSFKGLERTPAPLGHPTLNGRFLSARDPEGLNAHYIGAWNENVRQEGGRVLLDKVIDVEVANRTEGGKSVLSAIEKGGPIHTSTGLLCRLEAANGQAGHSKIARSMEFDHDAIMLDEQGAATPEQGVGMLVNAQGEQEEIEVINSALAEADRDLDWALESVARALEKRERAPLLDRMKTVLLQALGLEGSPSEQLNKDAEMTVSKEQLDALSAKVDALSESHASMVASHNEVVNSIKVMTDAHAQAVANQKAQDVAEHTDLVGKVVAANLLDEDTAKELTLNALRKLAPQATPGKAAALNAAYKPTGAKAEYQLPEGD
ncbi:hypothetical protein [Brevundimonas sp.]|uniref:hypothetical protein n=1 Tax=Brevundimonas sp. TaxID=1871086 RepID=UPI0025C62943|nr:hypothetical protein [Brevundimonas sp.]